MPTTSEDKEDKQPDHGQVNVDMLMRKMGKYALVSVVAKRAADVKARQLRAHHAEALENAVTLAMSDVAQGRVKVVKAKEPE